MTQRTIVRLYELIGARVNNRVGASPRLIGVDDLNGLNIWEFSSRTDDGLLDYSTITIVIKRLVRLFHLEGERFRLHHVVRGHSPENRDASRHHIGLAVDFSFGDRRRTRFEDLKRLLNDAGVRAVECIEYETSNGYFYHVGLPLSFAKVERFERRYTHDKKH